MTKNWRETSNLQAHVILKFAYTKICINKIFSTSLAGSLQSRAHLIAQQAPWWLTHNQHQQQQQYQLENERKTLQVGSVLNVTKFGEN